MVFPFCGKKAIDDNMYYLLKMAELTHTDVQSVSNHLLTSTTSFIRIVFLTEAMAKQFFQNFRMSKHYFRNRDPKNYSADTPIKIERDLALTEQAMMDQGLEHHSFGKTGKGRTKDKREGRCKARSKDTWESKGKGKGYQSERRTGKGTDRWSSYVPTHKADRTWNKNPRQQDDDPWAQASFGNDPRAHRSTGGRDYFSESEMIIPCAGCMNLFGTNSDCDDCVAYDGNANLEKLQDSLRYSHLRPFSQTVTQGFKCPLLRAKDQLCKGSQSLVGKGDCQGCVAWVQWAARYYGPRGQDSLNPVRHALILGYERSMLHTMQTYPELYVDALSNSLREINHRHDLPDDFTEWFTALYPDPNDHLRRSPGPKYRQSFRCPPTSTSSAQTHGSTI